MRILTVLLQKHIKNPTTIGITRTPSVRQRFVRVFFGKYLLGTNTLSCGILMWAGDIISQEIEYRRGNLPKRNWKRSGTMFLVGTLQGPIHHYFYRWLDKYIKAVNLVNVTKKILLDQAIMSPICILAFFYPSGLLIGQSLPECHTEVKSKFLTVYKMDWTVWPATQFINFYYLSPKYRVIYINIITMLYNVFLCYVKYKD